MPKIARVVAGEPNTSMHSLVEQLGRAIAGKSFTFTSVADAAALDTALTSRVAVLGQLGGPG